MADDVDLIFKFLQFPFEEESGVTCQNREFIPQESLFSELD